MLKPKVGELIIKPGSAQSAVCGQNGANLTNPDRQSIDLNIFTTSPVPYQIFQNDTEFDDEIFLIYCPDKQAEKTQLTGGDYYYNESLSNLAVILEPFEGHTFKHCQVPS